MKILRFVLLMVLVAVVALPAFAQDTFGLSDADAALLSSANNNSGAFDTVTYDFVLSLNLAGELSGLINGSGVIDNTNSVFTLAVDGSLTVSGQVQPANLEVRIVGDSLYVNLMDQWYAGSLSELMSEAEGMASSMSGDLLPVDPSELASGDMSGLMDDPAMMQALGALGTMEPSDFISISRNADDAQGRAAFQIALNIADLLSNPGVSAMLGGAMGGDMEMTAEQAAQMGQMFAMMLSGSRFTIDQYINQSTNLVERTVLDIYVDLAMMMGGMGSAGSAGSSAISLNFDINLSNYNQPVSVEQPTNTQPIEQLMESMSMMMGS